MEQKQKKKGTPPPRYNEAFKAGTVRNVTEQGRESREVAKDLGICIDTLCSWLKAAGVQLGQVSHTTREQQRIRESEAEIRAMCKQLVEKDEVIDILKKIRRHSVETIADQCHCIQTLHRQGTPVEQACRVLKISRSGCYGRARHNPCARERRNQALRRRLMEPHQNDLALGLDNLCHLLKPEFGCPRKHVHRQMRLAGIASVRCRACKVITNSRHCHPSPPI